MPTDIHNDPSLEQPHPPITPQQSVEDKLDVIIKYMHRIDRRDRMRMSWGIVHSLLTIIPLILTIASLWYFYENSGEILKGMMGFGGGSGTSQQQSIIDQIQNYLKSQGQ